MKNTISRRLFWGGGEVMSVFSLKEYSEDKVWAAHQAPAFGRIEQFSWTSLSPKDAQVTQSWESWVF